jgi:hypothetical protein
MRRIAIGAVLVTLVFTGCGDPSMSRATARNLRTDVAAIRSAVQDGQTAVAERRVQALQAEVSRLLESGKIERDAGLEILESAEGVLAVLDLAPRTSVSVTETVTPSPSEEDEDGGNAYGHDKDTGNGDEGHGNDD